MQTFFIIDDTKDLDKKINMIINNIGDDIKFFVKANLYTQISGNATVMHKIAGVFKNNEYGDQGWDKFITALTENI